MRMYRDDVISVTRIADVVAQWEEPTHDWGGRTAWRRFKAATFVLTEDPRYTTRLYRILDGVCETVH
jgi:hypothetical protein